MKNNLLLLILMFFSVGLFSQQSYGKNSIIVVKDDNIFKAVSDSGGKEHKVESDTMPVTIQDKSGNTYQIDKNGNITPVSTKSDIVLDNAVKNKPRPDIATLAFESTANTQYAVDQYKDIYAKVPEYFLKYKPTDEDMIASAKFMLPGASDEIFVRVTDAKEIFNPAKVKFVTDKGKEYKGNYNGKDGWTLTVLGSDANDGQNLYVVQEENPGKYATLARLNIYSYEPLERSVTLVPVNGKMNDLSKQSVADGLNKIYGKIGIHWTVNVLDAQFNYTPINGSTFNVTGSGLFSTLTDDMKAINEAFKQSGLYQEDGLYLFVLPFEASDKGEIAGTGGDMPLGSQFGYLFRM